MTTTISPSQTDHPNQIILYANFVLKASQRQPRQPRQQELQEGNMKFSLLLRFTCVNGRLILVALRASKEKEERYGRIASGVKKVEYCSQAVPTFVHPHAR